MSHGVRVRACNGELTDGSAANNGDLSLLLALRRHLGRVAGGAERCDAAEASWRSVAVLERAVSDGAWSRKLELPPVMVDRCVLVSRVSLEVVNKRSAP